MLDQVIGDVRVTSHDRLAPPLVLRLVVSAIMSPHGELML